jgi:endonuclease/exonuclease/phosphatase family metal-dependent hydrolase
MYRLVPVLILVSALAGCVPPKIPAMSPALAGACRSDSLRWFAPESRADRARLDSWCAGVGPAVLQPADFENAERTVAIDDLTFVSWNVHVGNGDVASFVRDLRSGQLTGGRPVRHFVLMLQEALRTSGVPPYDPHASGAQRINARDGGSIDIVEIGRSLGLSLIYVPSMRNGNSPEDAAADRGSAILSTLPLSDATAVELPGERQRRVAIVARISLPAPDAPPVSVGVIHLDALGASQRFWLFGTSWMRELQVKSLESLLPAGDLVLGADLNTWHGTAEPAPRFLAQLFAETPVSLRREGLGLRVLDYMFFRAAKNRTAHYQVVSHDYGSDHRPLVGWIE